MIPLTTLYDEYIDRPKLTEQKKPLEYIVPPSPLKWGRNNKRNDNVLRMSYLPKCINMYIAADCNVGTTPLVVFVDFNCFCPIYFDSSASFHPIQSTPRMLTSYHLTPQSFNFPINSPYRNFFNFLIVFKSE